MDLNGLLALLNACLTATALGCMVAGVRMIRRKNVRAHRNLMLAATAASAGFLVVFVIRFVRFGFRPFGGHGVFRALYLAIFFSHEPLAVVNVPLVLAALVLGLLNQVSAHREIASWAYPIWCYVAATGLLIYVFLYLAA